MNPFPFEDTIYRFTWEHPEPFRGGRGRRFRDWLGRRAFQRLLDAVTELGRQANASSIAVADFAAALLSHDPAPTSEEP